MSYLNTLQKDALDALIMKRDDELGNDSFKKEIMYLLQSENGLITEEAFNSIVSRYTQFTHEAWQDFQEQLRYKHASRTVDFISRVQQFSTKFQNFKVEVKALNPAY